MATPLLFLSACGAEGDSASSGRSATASPGSQSTGPEQPSPVREGGSDEPTARVVDTAFRPRVVTVEADTPVVWRQVGDQPHSVTAVDETFDSNPRCSPLDSGRCLERGDDFTHVFEESGTFAYYCRVHGRPDGTGMAGVIEVK